MKNKRNSKEKLRKKRQLQKQKHNEGYNNFTRELYKEKPLTFWERIKLYFNRL